MSQSQRIRPSIPPPGAPGVPKKTSESKVNVSFEFIDAGRKYCLSKCDRRQAKIALSGMQKMCRQSWTQVLESGGKSNKSGLHYEEFRSNQEFKGVQRPAHLAKEKKIASVRANDKVRIYGYREGNTFFVLWIDPVHVLVK